jgi:thiosulfate dehydrogenase [quinone] large subunit
MTSSKTHSVSVLCLLPLRLSIGVAFLVAGQGKISAGNWGAAYESSLYDFVMANLENAYAFYRPFLESIVIPHAGKFAVLVAWGEILVGVSIFLGLFTRFGAAVGIFMVLNYTFALGLGVWVPGLESLYIWSLFTFMACSAGREMGVDQVLRSRKRIRLFT